MQIYEKGVKWEGFGLVFRGIFLRGGLGLGAGLGFLGFLDLLDFLEIPARAAISRPAPSRAPPAPQKTQAGGTLGVGAPPACFCWPVSSAGRCCCSFVNGAGVAR